MKHNYSDPQLPTLVMGAVDAYARLVHFLVAIQEATGIPGLHTNINSDDLTPGVLERIQTLHENTAEDASPWELFEMFQSEDGDD